VAVEAAAEGPVRPQVLANGAISSLAIDPVQRQVVEAFLGVPLPNGFGTAQSEQLRYMTQPDLQELMLERAPFFFIERAVAIGDHTVLGVAHITVDRSAGHFPSKPIVPLIELCKAMAQTGIVLASLHASPHEAPIAIGAGESKALAKELIVAPVSVLITASLRTVRLGVYVADGAAFIAGNRIGTLSKIMYALVSREQLLA